MRRLLITAVMALAGSPVWAVSSALAPQAEQAWQHRDQPGQTEAAIKAWEAALKQDPSRVDLYIPLTRASGRAYRHAESGKGKIRWADTGREYGALAVSKNPASAEAHAVYGEALGQWAQAHKGVHSLKAVKQAVASLEKAVVIDPQDAYAHMLLAQFYQESPGWLSVGDKKKAFVHAQKAVEYGGTYAINRLTLAKIYLDRGQKAEAREQLEKIATLKPPADAVPETKSDQETARGLLKGL